MLLAACGSTATTETPSSSVHPTASLAASSSATTSTSATPTLTPTSQSPTPTPTPTQSPSPTVAWTPSHCRAPDGLGVTLGSSQVNSTNAAGYVVEHGGALATCAEAAWVIPATHCYGGATQAADIEVGLGGTFPGDRSSEQVGLEILCIGGGAATYRSWYVTAGDQRSVDLPFTQGFFMPGTHVWAQVSLSHGRVTFTLANLDTSTPLTGSERLKVAGSKSAAWIVGPPTICDLFKTPCHRIIEDQAMFSRITLTGAVAVMGGRLGPIGAMPWTRSRNVSPYDQTSVLQPGGSSFWIGWRKA